jgi:hypothetical protein
MRVAETRMGKRVVSFNRVFSEEQAMSTPRSLHPPGIFIDSVRDFQSALGSVHHFRLIDRFDRVTDFGTSGPGEGFQRSYYCDYIESDNFFELIAVSDLDIGVGCFSQTEKIKIARAAGHSVVPYPDRLRSCKIRRVRSRRPGVSGG